MNVVPITIMEPDEATFDDFWILYPRHEAKKDAKKMWDRLTPAQQMEALIGLASWRKVYMARGWQYIPLPATWINGERWEDELPSEFRQVTSASHIHIVPQESGKGAPMPDHVRQLIARLKK